MREVGKQDGEEKANSAGSLEVSHSLDRTSEFLPPGG